MTIPKEHERQMREICFEVHLLSDLHCGTGHGYLSLVDDTQAKDRYGFPVVRASVLRGILRHALEEMAELDRDLESPGFNTCESMVSDLLGREIDKSARLQVQSLHFGPPKDQSNRDLYLTVTSTSRAVHSRLPEPSTLRTIEFARAGLVARGCIRGIMSEHEQKVIADACRRINHIGGRRSRGNGKCAIRNLTCRSIANRLELSRTMLGNAKASTCRLRLVLRNLEPICFTASALAGNEVVTRSYVTGNAVRGTIFTALSTLGVPRETIDQWMANNAIQFRYAYPIASQPINPHAIELNHLQSIPMPLSSVEPKASASQVSDSPWWLLPQAAESQGRDRTSIGYESIGDEKRVKAEDYLVTVDGRHWQRLSPREVTIMRNRIPVGRFLREFDSRRQNAQGDDLSKSELFTETAIDEDHYWLTDIVFANDAIAKDFVEASLPLFNESEKDRHWLRIGRGGRPWRIERAGWVREFSDSSALDPSKTLLRIMLATDLIGRNDWLQHFTTLDLGTLSTLVPALTSVNGWAEVQLHASYSESTSIHSFRTNAGVRAAMEVGIRRGSVIVLKGPTHTLHAISSLLNSKMATGLGMHTETGHGQFVLESSAHDAGWGDEPSSKNLESAERDRERWKSREHVLSKVFSTSIQGSSKLSKSQWQQLRHDVEAISTVDSLQLNEGLNRIVKCLVDHTKKIAGKDWKPWIVPIQKQLESFGTDSRAKRDYLVFLARLQTIRMSEESTDSLVTQEPK